MALLPQAVQRQARLFRFFPAVEGPHLNTGLAVGPDALAMQTHKQPFGVVGIAEHTELEDEAWLNRRGG